MEHGTRYAFENTPFLYAVQYSVMLFISKVVEFLDINIFGIATDEKFLSVVCMY